MPAPESARCWLCCCWVWSRRGGGFCQGRRESWARGPELVAVPNRGTLLSEVQTEGAGIDQSAAGAGDLLEDQPHRVGATEQPGWSWSQQSGRLGSAPCPIQVPRALDSGSAWLALPSLQLRHRYIAAKTLFSMARMPQAACWGILWPGSTTLCQAR